MAFRVRIRCSDVARGGHFGNGKWGGMRWWEGRTFTAQGARFLKERPWTRLWRWMVYSRVTTSSNALRLPVYPKWCDISQPDDGRQEEMDGPFFACLWSQRGTRE